MNAKAPAATVPAATAAASAENARLFAAVVHDLKNRLAILGDELTKLSRLELAPEARGHAEAAAEQTALLTRKLVEALTAQKVALAGGLHAASQEELPGLFLEDVAADARPLLAGRIELAIEAGDAPAFWFFDRHLVRLALDSALYNARRFAISRIVLGVCLDDGHLCFSVRDDGPGVQHEPGKTSTGLGGLVCDEVARAHKNRGRTGRARLRNHPQGGAVFELLLP